VRTDIPVREWTWSSWRFVVNHDESDKGPCPSLPPMPSVSACVWLDPQVQSRPTIQATELTSRASSSALFLRTDRVLKGTVTSQSECSIYIVWEMSETGRPRRGYNRQENTLLVHSAHHEHLRWRIGLAVLHVLRRTLLNRSCHWRTFNWLAFMVVLIVSGTTLVVAWFDSH